MSEQEKRERAAWQAANAQARREDKRASWAECCGRPTFEPVAVCHECAVNEAVDEVRARFETAFSRNRALAKGLILQSVARSL